MPERSPEEKVRFFLTAALPLLIVFWLVLLFYGAYLTPQSFGALPKNIREVHIISLFFRADAWHFPLTLTKTISPPQGFPLALSDGIPLAALLFKAFGFYTHQYFGVWLLFSFSLTVFFAYRISRRIFKKAPLPTGLGTALFIFMPFAWYHPYSVPWTAGQWLTLWALSLFFQKRRKLSKEWYGVVVLSALVHPFFLLTNIFLAVADIIRLYLYKHRISIMQAATFFSNIFALSFFTAAFSGLFYAQTFVDSSLPHPPLIPSYFFRPEAPAAYSPSYFYPGLGILLGLLPTPLIALFNPAAKYIRRYRPLIFCFVVFFFLSLGGGILIGGSLLKIPPDSWLSQRVLPMFSSGPRFLTPILWVLPILVLQNLAWLEKSGRKPLSGALLIAALALQIFQFHVVLPEAEKEFLPLEKNYANFLADRGELIWIHSESGFYRIPYFEELAYYAFQEGKKISSAPSARIGSGYRPAARKNRAAFFAKEFNTNAVYIIEPQNVTADLNKRGKVLRMKDVFLFKVN